MAKPPVSTLSLLTTLESHFAALAPRKVTIKGLPELFYHPLDAEQMFKFVAASRCQEPAKQAQLFAELLVDSVKLENGKPAFELVPGGPNPVEVLTKKTVPATFSALIAHLGKDAPKKQAEDLAKK